MVTVEFASTASGCALRVTDQLAILSDGDSAAERERGWGETLDKLGPALADA